MQKIAQATPITDMGTGTYCIRSKPTIMVQSGRNEEDNIAEIDMMSTLHLDRRSLASSQRIAGRGLFSPKNAIIWPSWHTVKNIPPEPSFSSLRRSATTHSWCSGLMEIRVVTFARENDVVTFPTDPLVDAQPWMICSRPATPAVQGSICQMQSRRTVSAIRKTEPPPKAFLSTFAPGGDPNSLLRAGCDQTHQ